MNSLVISRNLLKNLKQFVRSSARIQNFQLKHAFYSDLSIDKNSNLEQKNHQKTPNIKKYHDSLYECVYEFRHINPLRILTRFKLYQTFFTTTFAAYSILTFDDTQILLLSNGTMLLALIMLFVISRQVVRVVGRMYISDDKSKVLISHLDFFGKRRDFEVEISEIESLASLAELKDAFIYLRLRDTSGSMIISLPHGKVHNKEMLLKILGAD